MVPATLDCNARRFGLPQGFRQGDGFVEHLRGSFDVLCAEGADCPAMMRIGLHCDAFARRLGNPPDFARDEALRNLHRMAERRLADKFGIQPALGHLVWVWVEERAAICQRRGLSFSLAETLRAAAAAPPATRPGRRPGRPRWPRWPPWACPSCACPAAPGATR